MSITILGQGWVLFKFHKVALQVGEVVQEWCEKQATPIDHAVGCYYIPYSYDYYGSEGCIFLKSGIIDEEKMSAHEDGNVTEICWKLELGNIFNR